LTGQPDESVGVPLLASKLAAPPVPGGLVERPRLHSLLDDAARGPLTLVTAPAGWGKTVLLSCWLAAGGPGLPVGWLSVEPGDDGRHFWPYLRAALDSAGLPPLPAPGPVPDEVFLVRFADALARLPEPVLLVLDDFHHVQDPGVLSGLEFLLRHATARLRVVIAARAEPALPLHRWLLHGELAQLRTDELSFTAAETAALLERHGLTLPAPDLDALHAHTEGWPAGVRLAMLAAQEQAGRPIHGDGPCGADPRVADYLFREVLAGQPGEMREVLVTTSILERVTGGLVDALTGRSDGEQILAGLERTNTFLIPLEAGGSWYRYHRMFGELLRSELRRQAAGRIPELHRRAAGWHAAHGLAADALRHALAAQDWSYATEVLVRHWHHIVRYGHDKSLPALVPPPPAEALRADPELALAFAADRLDLLDLDRAADYLRLADRHQHLLAEDRRDRFALMAAAFRLAQAQLGGDVAAVRSAAARMLAQLGQAGRGGPADRDAADRDAADRSAADQHAADQHAADRDAADRETGTEDAADEGAAAIALTALGSAELAAGDLDAAAVALSDGLARAQRAGLSCPQPVCASRLAFIQAVRGELRGAERTARAALHMPLCPGQSRPVHCAHAYLALAVVDLQRCRPDHAEASLDLAASSDDPTAGPALAALIAILRAQLLWDRGDLATAYQILLAGRRDLGDWQPSKFLEHWFTAVEADLRTAHGDPDAVRRQLEPLVDGAPADIAPLAVALAGAYLHSGDPRAAIRVLPPWWGAQTMAGSGDAGPADDGGPAQDGTGQPLALRLTAGVIEAQAARQVGDARRASRILERMLRLAEPEGFRQVFVRAGTPVREMLLDHLDSGTAYWPLVSELIAATGDRPEPGGGPPPVLGEPLTERELTVLRYLQSILSNVEIASALSLSVNTVKTHVRSIYRKLDTTRRREAVRKARELHLL
jgi:LuxR family maltose regulon positive regulatory protein